MTAEISLSHPNPFYRGKDGKVFQIRYTTRKLYTYGKNDKSDNQSGIIYIPAESFRIYNESQPDLIKRGFTEYIKEIPTDNIASVDMYIDTMNRTDSNGFHTLLGVLESAYEKITVEGKYITLINYEEDI